MNKVPEDFTPNQSVLDLAHKRGITMDFINEQLPEFIFYWTDKGTRRKSWQRSFWNWLKLGWSRKMEKERSTRGTMPQSNVMWESEKVEKAKSRPSLQDLKRLI